MQQMGRLSSSIISSYNKPRRILTRMDSKGNNTQCKKHPKHRQSPGVCSLCLSEKLSRVSTSSSSSSSSRPYYYCSSSSLSSSEDDTSYASSPDVIPRRHRRIASDVVLKTAAAAGFSKSRSMAFAAPGDGRLRSEEININVNHNNNNNNNNKKVISGFWSKLLRPRRSEKLRDTNTNYHHSNKIIIISQS